MNTGSFTAIRVSPRPTMPAARPAQTMDSLVVSWLKRVTSQRDITHDGFMAYGRYVKDPRQIANAPALNHVFDGLIKLHGENSQLVANQLLSFLVRQNAKPAYVGRLVANARAALRLSANPIVQEMILLVKCADAGRPATRSSAPFSEPL